MRVLTLKQPHATLVVYGLKKIETRSWCTQQRGRIAIHASSAIDRWVHAACVNPIIRAALEGLGFRDVEQLQFGKILGEVDLLDCLYMVNGRATVPTIQFSIDHDERLTPREREMGIYARGRRAWILENPRRYEVPVPARGARGLWWYNDPGLVQP